MLFRYLEKNIFEIRDPFEVAIVTYLLTLADSPEKDTAFSRLHSLRTEDGRYVVVEDIFNLDIRYIRHNQE